MTDLVILTPLSSVICFIKTLRMLICYCIIGPFYSTVDLFLEKSIEVVVEELLLGHDRDNTIMFRKVVSLALNQALKSTAQTTKVTAAGKSC